MRTARQYAEAALKNWPTDAPQFALLKEAIINVATDAAAAAITEAAFERLEKKQIPFETVCECGHTYAIHRKGIECSMQTVTGKLKDDPTGETDGIMDTKVLSECGCKKFKVPEPDLWKCQTCGHCYVEQSVKDVEKDTLINQLKEEVASLKKQLAATEAISAQNGKQRDYTHQQLAKARDEANAARIELEGIKRMNDALQAKNDALQAQAKAEVEHCEKYRKAWLSEVGRNQGVQKAIMGVCDYLDYLDPKSPVDGSIRAQHTRTTLLALHAKMRLEYAKIPAIAAMLDMADKLKGILEWHGTTCHVNGEPCWNCRTALALNSI